MATVPPLDRIIGISTYSTSQEGIGGRIRAKPDDFVVTEILDSRITPKESGRYAVYLLAKRRIDTGHCLSEIFAKRRLRLKALGLKDAAAVTNQYLCATATGKGIAEFNTSRYRLQRIGYVDRPLTKKWMVGNRFEITIQDATRSASEFGRYDIIRNYYGYQRFGSRRPITHRVGQAIIHSDYKEAIRLILSETSPFDTDEANALRQKLADPANHTECLHVMPKSMDIERTVIGVLQEGGDERVAFLALPLYLRRLYVQAYQSYLFNLTLDAAAAQSMSLYAQDGDVSFDETGRIGKYQNGQGQRLAIPMVGYAYYKKTRFHSIIRDILYEQGVAPRDFYIKKMQEVSAEGGFRQALLECTKYAASQNHVQFTLSRGSFATMILREIMKPSDPVAAGF